MNRALGWSYGRFDPFEPGRLCRGRERWIDPWETEAAHPSLYRTVFSGAAFSDDTAKDAFRGVPFSRIPLHRLIDGFFPGRPLLVVAEDAHPADLPPLAEGIEAYTGHRAGGRAHEAMVRWHARVENAAALAQVVCVSPGEAAVVAQAHGLPEEYGADLLAGERIRAIVVLDDETRVDEELFDRLFLLMGMSTLDSPPARFQPAALPEVLARCPAVIALHRDKHGPAIGIYGSEPPELRGVVGALCAEYGALMVPFAIPPMLARWDRAIADLRVGWDEASKGPFPVPRGAGNGWERRRRRGRAAEEGPGAAGVDPIEDLLEEAVLAVEDEPVRALGERDGADDAGDVDDDDDDEADDDDAADDDEADDDDADDDDDEADDDEADDDEADEG